MGEMIKFGLKMALTIACALALCAAIVLLFNAVTSVLPSTSGSAFLIVREIFQLICIVIPINIELLFTMLTGLFTFKVSYWAADKMLEFINAIG